MTEDRSVASAIALYWIPLGAGGVGFVRVNGRIYEAVQARRERRLPQHLYHTALEVHQGGRRFIIENAWPSPNSDLASRGVVVEGPVFLRRMARFRPFRYEVRCWEEGVIVDAQEAVGSPQILTRDPELADRILGLAGSVPPLTWGRDQLNTGEMWNSNSVVSWILARGGIRVDEIHPPEQGRAPGWKAGIDAASRSIPTELVP